MSFRLVPLLAVVAIRCPTCGSAAASTATSNEYECSHCRTRFQLVRPSDAMVVTDERAHHCPLCGRPVKTTEAFRCTECGRSDFCNACVASIPSFGAHRFVCRTCMSQKGWACSTCGTYATATCIVCHRRTCGDHYTAVFASTSGSRIYYLNCPACRGQVCINCAVIKSGVFSTHYYCRKCGTELSQALEQGKYCPYCHHTVAATSAFCPFCGKAMA
jgi:DNA-directed RNA polymerase subunit RPC12/RpoP